MTMTENPPNLTPVGVNEHLEEIEIARIIHGRFQYRDSSSDLTEVTESIRQHGLIVPILVRPLPTGQFELVCGHTRLQAHRDLGLGQIKAIVRELSDDEASKQSFIDNHERHSQDWKDEARYFKKWMTDTGLSERELARQLGGKFSYHYIQERVQRLHQLEEAGLQASSVPLSKVPELLGLKNPRRATPRDSSGESYWYHICVPSDIHSVLQNLSKSKAEATIVEATRLYLQQMKKPSLRRSNT